MFITQESAVERSPLFIVARDAGPPREGANRKLSVARIDIDIDSFRLARGGKREATGLSGFSLEPELSESYDSRE